MNQIQKLRVKNNLSQEELAKLLSVDRSTVAKWETGGVLPRADKLPYLSKILNCSIDELFKNEPSSDRR